ncbi:hypothetical protein A2U01_0009142, partial [Trifolium medium]|nr:hypothetical protein [Trifolium medium]
FSSCKFNAKLDQEKAVLPDKVISVDQLQQEDMCPPINQKDHETQKEQNIQFPSGNVPNADETPTDNSSKKIFTVTDLERQNDNDFNHSASEEVLEEEIVQVHTGTAQNNTQNVDPNMLELVPDLEEEVVAQTQIILQQLALPQVVLDDMEKIRKA